MHTLYVQKYEEDLETPKGSYDYHLKYFQENFNLLFRYPKADT